jgi:phosphate transport system substrate-binding protein
MTHHPDVAVYVDGGGTGTGVDALVEGSVDICSASRPLEAEEIRRLVERYGSLGFSILCARDALSIYLHPGNPVKDLSLAQVKDILTGVVTNWKSVGGEDWPIRVATREPNSGTYLFLKEHILLGEDYTPSAETLPGTNAIVRFVEQDTAAVGYGGFAYGQGVYHSSIDGVEPTPENVRNGTYLISRYLYLYTVQPPAGPPKEFIDWVLGSEGQRIVEEVGYISLFDFSKLQAPR